MSLVEALEGLAVMVTKSKYRGRVGMVTDINLKVWTFDVQFGTDGPTDTFSDDEVRPATRGEVNAMGLAGVGGLKVLEDV